MSRSLSVVIALLAVPVARAEDNAGLAFFEQKIRPVLVKECYSCHSDEAKKGPKGGLRVDSRDALLKGGDSGPAVVAGKPTESLLVKALHGDEIADMPPKGKLSPAVIADFEQWVKMGAPDPRTGKVTATAEIDLAKGREFWSFRPVTKPTIPPGDGSAIDKLLAAKWASVGLTPSGDADKYTLLRRVTIDLTGLPPRPDEIAAFVADQSPTAFETVVDRLLASPQYGERWGRHWLDLARYADSNGKDENLTFHEAYLYRDYVIRSFNADKPFDQFTREQIAGDLLPAASVEESDKNMIATGYLVLGPKVLADRDKEKRFMDVVDEQIDTVGKTFLGLTLGCARCHDHKFDPVPTADYYALAGIFASTRTLDGIKLGNPVVSGWSLRPLGGAAGEKLVAARKEYDAKVKKLEAGIKKAKADLTGAQDKTTMRVAGKLVGVTVDDPQAVLVGDWKASVYTKPYVGDGYKHDDKAGKGTKTATYTPTLPKAGEYDVFMSYTAGGSRPKNVPVTVRFDGGENTVAVDQTKPPKIDGLFHKLGTFKFAAGNKGSVVVGTTGTDGNVIIDAMRFVPSGELGKVPEAAMGVPADVKEKVAAATERVKKLEVEEAALKKTAPPPPRMAMAVVDQNVADAKINVRGNPHQLGQPVPRGFLQVVSTTRPTIPKDQSGRKELADFLTEPRNPLTARVTANRVWMHLYGEGVCRTVDNFGVQGEAPLHPELLDYLAGRFVELGWSHKRLIREVVLTRAYRRAVAPPAKQDLENRLFSRSNRRRADAEVIRDAILTVAGNLDVKGGGTAIGTFEERAIDNNSKGGANVDGVTKRSVYLPLVRNDMPAILSAFDIADPDVSTGRRDATTVSTQALFLMNSPFVLAQARAAADRLKPLSPEERVRTLFLRALGREPSAAETAATLGFVAEYGVASQQQGSARTPKDPDATAWAAVVLAVFGSTEFRFVE